MTTRGIVKAINERNEAIVSCARESACDGCHKKEEGQCSVCSLMGAGGPMEIRVKNRLHAKVGDTVEIQSSTGRVLLYAVLTFIVPVIIPLLFYFFAYTLLQKQGVAVICSAASFAVYFLLLRLFSEKVLGSTTGEDNYMTGIIICEKADEDKIDSGDSSAD